MCKPRFKQVDIVRQIFGKLLQLGNQPCAAPEAEQSQQGKQQQNPDDGTDATGNMKFLQAVCQRVKQQAQQPPDEEWQENPKKIAKEQTAAEHRRKQQDNIMNGLFIFFVKCPHKDTPFREGKIFLFFIIIAQKKNRNFIFTVF